MKIQIHARYDHLAYIIFIVLDEHVRMLIEHLILLGICVRFLIECLLDDFAGGPRIYFDSLQRLLATFFEMRLGVV